jgi:hypothetical protein
MPQPTQSVPGGFLVVFFGMLALVFSGLCGYASWLVYQKECVQHQSSEYSLTQLLLLTAGGFVVATSMITVGLRMAYRTAPYDTRDPEQPLVKF